MIDDKLARELFSQVLPDIQGSGIIQDRLPQMLALDKHFRVGARIAVLLELMANELTGPVTVPVDYDAPNALSKAIQAIEPFYTERKNRYYDPEEVIQIEDIPLFGSGKKEHEVFELHLGLIQTCDLLPELEIRQLEFADPLTALLYDAQAPDRQLKYLMTIFFTDKKGRFCHLILGDSRIGSRSLDLDKGFLNASYGQGKGRFLVVRKT